MPSESQPLRSEREEDRSSDEILDALAQSYLEECRRGARPSLEELAGRHPELAHEIEELFPLLSTLENAGEAISNEQSQVFDLPELGDFRIVRELGRGGMGVVYEAVQRSLERQVALKVLTGHARLDPRHRQRFRREAQAAARLRNPNIVPVFEVGEAQGVHYYAMQLIEGAGLDAVLREVRVRLRGSAPVRSEPEGERDLDSELASRLLSSGPAALEVSVGKGAAEEESSTGSGAGVRYFRKVAGMGLQVARALAYAHGEGVLHRDLKPSNLLLDLEGKVWITDFGLAKTAGSDAITHSGDVLGTPRYLSPESLRGWSDPRTDVWGLGVTLYELLALRPAFRGRHRAELLRRIAEREPTAPRRFERRIPRDLETIVLTALEKEPGRRYASALAFAEDLERFLQGKPIQARRASLVHRGGLFLKRHRLASSAVALALVLLAAGTTIWSFTLRAARDREASARQGLAQSLLRERGVRREAEANYQLARQAVDRMLHRLGTVRLFGMAGVEKLRRDVLSDAVEFYREFVRRRSEDAGVRREAGIAWARLGDIELELDNVERAEACLRRAEELLRKLAGPTGRTAERCELGTVLVLRAQLFYTQGRFAEAEEKIGEGLELLRQLPPGAQPSPLALAWLLRAISFSGEVLLGTNRFGEAVETLDRGIQLARACEKRIPAGESMDERIQYGFLSCLERRGQALRGMGRLAEAESDLERARALALPLATKKDAKTNARWSLARIDCSLGHLDHEMARRADAEQAYRRSIETYEQLMADLPAVTSFAEGCAEARVFLGIVLQERNQLKEAGDLLEGTIEEYDRRVCAERGSIDAGRKLALAWIGLGNLRWARHQLDGAREAYRKAISRIEEQRARTPALERFAPVMSALATAHGNLGSLLKITGLAEKGERELRRSLALCRALHEGNPASLEYARQLIFMSAKLGGLLAARGAVAEAEELLRSSRDLAARLSKSFPGDERLGECLAASCFQLGTFLMSAGKTEEADRELGASAGAYERILRGAPSNVKFLTGLAATLNSRAIVQLRGRHFAAARELLEKAIGFQGKALEVSRGSILYQRDMVSQLGNLCIACEGLDDVAAVAATARRMDSYLEGDPIVRLKAVRRLCRCAFRLGKERGKTYADEAMGLLEKAIELGFRDAGRLRSDRNLVVLRDREDFQALLRRLE